MTRGGGETLRHVEVAGARLAVASSGSGPPLVLLHGFAGDRGLWDEVAPRLARSHRVIRYDLRGYGDSAAANRDPFSHARDLAALLDALSLQRCDLLGASMGGSIALHFALDQPQRVRRLVLASPGLVAWEWSEHWRAAWAPIVDAARGGDLQRARELWWQHELFATARAAPAAAVALRQSIQRYSGAHWIDGDDEQPALPDVERLASLRVPTLLLTGAADLPDFRLIADLIEAAAADVRRIDYAGAGHMVHLERPDDFVADAMRFLARPD
jgi:2-succinyl-6-hydroxy-2,4-cyclohexadiene-1-carboxylate synthase